MGIFDKRGEAKKVEPRNLDKDNPVIKKAEALADSYQKILKGWERNLPLIEKKICEIAKSKTYDYDSKIYYCKRIMRKFGGDIRLVKDLVDKHKDH